MVIPLGEAISKLQKAFIRMQRGKFMRGQCVQWKNKLQNKSVNGPFIVVSILDMPIFERGEEYIGTNYWREPLDIIVGAFVNEIYCEIYLDSRRLEGIA